MKANLSNKIKVVLLCDLYQLHPMPNEVSIYLSGILLNSIFVGRNFLKKSTTKNIHKLMFSTHFKIKTMNSTKC